MKTKKLTSLLITLLLVFPAVSKDDSYQPKALSETHQASCILKITANPDLFIRRFSCAIDTENNTVQS